MTCRNGEGVCVHLWQNSLSTGSGQMETVRDLCLREDSGWSGRAFWMERRRIRGYNERRRGEGEPGGAVEPQGRLRF
ncbi:protein of unknown function [Kyrpidia spormannii]|uniref:Uncharacterized protein n=1 Tax=Kyrpidia spormannii TaxID=2055160 RepID=A0A6F9E237_9BACL|nr:protein of unknown function [Kyrpidia spormannii]